MRRQVIRVTVVGVLLAAPVQAAWRIEAPEPWPALYQPAFRHVPEAPGETKVRIPTVTAVAADGEEVDLTGEELFAGYRITVPQAMQVLFWDGLDDDGQLKRERRSALLRYLARGSELGQYRDTTQPRHAHESLAAFLRHRMDELVEFDVDHVRVTWTEERYDTTATLIDAAPAGPTVRVQL